MNGQHLCWVLAATVFAGCMDDDILTEHERSVLATMVLDDSTPIPTSRTNRYADDLNAAKLGQALFFENRWLNPMAQNCRSCHDLTNGGADTKATGPTTVNSVTMVAGNRNTPTVFNVAMLPSANHWAGLFHALWSIPGDVGTSTLQQAHFMYNDPYYRSTYEALFGPLPDLSDTVRFPAVGNWRAPAFQAMAPEDQLAMNRFATNLGKSLEAYERQLMDRNSAFDRFMNGDETAMSAPAIRGAKLFVGKAACNECHNGPAFSDFDFHNIGVPQGAGVPKVDYGRIAAGFFQSTYPYNANSQFSDDIDYGTSTIANMSVIPTAELPTACNAADPMPGCGSFKTARLRSVALTPPYMHTGGITNLWDVVAFYNQAAGTDNFVGKRDHAIQPLFLTNSEMEDLVAFLTALTGAPIADEWSRCPKTIPASACSAP